MKTCCCTVWQRIAADNDGRVAFAERVTNAVNDICNGCGGARPQAKTLEEVGT